MPRICDYAVIKPLSIIYKTCIKNVIYSDTRKKCNIVPVQKKGDKQMVNNYRPHPLLRILGKIFEKILFNSNFEYLQEKTLFFNKQSGF